MSKAKCITRWSVIPLSLLLLVGMALAGCGGGSSISDIMKKSEQAEAKITSLRQTVDWVYDIPQVGTGTVQSSTVMISSNSVQKTEVVLGTVIAERIMINGKQWTKNYPDNKWVEDAATTTTSTSAETQSGQYTNLVSNSTSQKQLADESVNGYTCYHLQFELSAENVKNIVQQVPKENLTANNGGTVDIWIDTQDYYMIKSEGSFGNVNITDLGYVNLKIVISRTNINQPIVINPPV